MYYSKCLLLEHLLGIQQYTLLLRERKRAEEKAFALFVISIEMKRSEHISNH